MKQNLDHSEYDLPSSRRTGSQFWKDRQSEFDHYSKQYSQLRAFWKAEAGRWLLWWGATTNGINIPKECEGIFKALTKKAIIGLATNVEGAAEPWSEWLNVMRVAGWGFNITRHVACTETEWDEGVKAGRSLTEIRRERQYTTGDEWTNIYRRLESGELELLSEEYLAGKSSDDLRQYFHWLEEGIIEHLFSSSASFCEKLAADAFEIEAATDRGHFLPKSSRVTASEEPSKTIRTPGLNDHCEAIPSRLRTILDNYKVESGLRGADFLERAVKAVERDGHSLQEQVDYIIHGIELLGNMLLSANDLSVDDKIQLLQEYVSGMVDHIHEYYGSDPLIDHTFVPRLERGVVVWTAHFQREIWTAEHEKLANQPKCDKQAAEFGENVNGIQGYAQTDLAKNAPDGLIPQVVESVLRKKRGRPIRIPDEKKAHALTVEGITKRAQILYQTRYPTAQQKKNVHSILRHFKKERSQAAE